jgi:YesN/AraC family two-component response regulator
MRVARCQNEPAGAQRRAAAGTPESRRAGVASRTRVPQKPSLLVVDDDAALREALTLALADRFVVHTAVCGAEALTVLRAHPIALIVLDVVLQDEHGLELIDPFRRVSPARILILTGQGSEAVAARACWERVDGYLPKPVPLVTLRAAVDRLVLPTGSPMDLAWRARQALDSAAAQPFDPVEFACHLGVSEVQLRRCFREAYHLTPHQYLTRARLQNAATLLRTTPLGVEQIALTVGFPTVVWFNKCFRRAFGMPPQAYRGVR